MAYLGSKPQNGFISNAKERYTGITTAYVDLNHSISSLADVIVWVNFVKQDSTNLTLTSSTRITLGGTLVSSDIVEIAYLGKAVATQTPDTGTVTNDMLAGSIANSKLANSSVSINGSSVALGGSITGIGEANTPYFAARLNANQSVSDQTTTKIAFDTEELDSDNAFTTGASANFTVPSGKAGKYFLSVHTISYPNDGNSMLSNNVTSIRKNDSQIVETYTDYSNNQGFTIGASVDIIVDLAVGDVITFFAYLDAISGNVYLRGATDRRTYCHGFRISAS